MTTKRKEALRKKLAKAWNRGYHAAVADYEEDTPTSEKVNPYHKRKKK